LRYLNNAYNVTIQREHVTVDAIDQRYYLVNEQDKLAALTRIFEVEDIYSALIFVRTRSGTGELANELTVRGYPAESLNGDMAQETREMTLNRFRKNQIKVLVATDVAARGLDIDDISHVFNYDLPHDPEIYVHRIGRTGRAGKTGISISLVTPAEKRKLSHIEAFARKKIARANPPTDEDIRKFREQLLENSLMIWLKRGRCKQERALVEKWVEQGFDPIEIATAALKVARADEKQRPVDPISEVIELKPARPERNSRRPSRDMGPVAWSSTSHEPGMMRLSLDVGRKDGIRPNDIVGAIAYHADIPGHTIGKILISDRSTLVDIPETLATKVLAKTGEVQIRRQSIHVQRA
jgi:ATP-dependent RNA helicase DeaD